MTEDELIAKHPYVLGSVYIGVGPGWYGLLDVLATQIEQELARIAKDPEFGWGPCGNCHVEALVPPGKRCQVCDGAGYTDNGGRTFRPIQLKEKFGGARCYMDGETPAITKAIRDFEEKSFQTCETCGKPGRPSRAGGWMETVCVDHKALRDASDDSGD